MTQGHVLRHAPAQSPQGRDAAVIDIAQDLLLRHLSECGVLTLVAFKGGTALRKVYAGAAGRFSTDLDFSVASLDDDPAAVIQLLVGQIDDTRLGPFTYSIDERRGRYTILYQSDLGPDPTGPLQSKIDVGPPPWLAPTGRSWVDVPIHSRYGGPLPQLPVVDLAENVAEKIARLNRRSPARDAYRTSRHQSDRSLQKGPGTGCSWATIPACRRCPSPKPRIVSTSWSMPRRRPGSRSRSRRTGHPQRCSSVQTSGNRFKRHCSGSRSQAYTSR